MDFPFDHEILNGVMFFRCKIERSFHVPTHHVGGLACFSVLRLTFVPPAYCFLPRPRGSVFVTPYPFSFCYALSNIRC